MARYPRLADLIGLTPKQIEESIKDSVLQASEVVAEEFRRILASLQTNSENGVFDGYSVVVKVEPYVAARKHLGKLKLVRCHIWVDSPDPKINVFDILDTGRKALPERGSDETPYPLWSLSNPRLVSRPGERRRDPATGRFTITTRPTSVSGKRPEKLRYKLLGPRKKGFQYSPAIYTRGPIAAVPPGNLYRRVFNIAKKKLKREGFQFLDLIIAEGRRD